VNFDGSLTPGDALIAFEYYMDCELQGPTFVEYCAADFCGSGIIDTCDGSVTPADARGILLAYLLVPDPCAKSSHLSNY